MYYISSPSCPGKHLYLVGPCTGLRTYRRKFELVLASPLIGATSQQRRGEALSEGNFHHQLAHIVLLGLEDEEPDKGGIRGNLSHLS